MTKEELEEIIAFLNSLVKGYDEINNRITYFAGYLLGKAVARSSRDSEVKTEESTMKYQKVQIKRRKDGRWYARYTLAPCKYLDIYGRTQSECYEKLKAFADDKRLIAQKIKALEAPKKKTTFKEFFDIWYRKEKEPTCQKQTLYEIRNKYKNYLSEFDDYPIQDITAEDIREFLLDIEHDSVRSKCCGFLSDIFKKALIYDVVETNVMEKVTRYKYDAEPQDPFTLKEEAAFVEEAQKYESCNLIFWLMLYEGLRTSEAKAVTPSDIKDEYIIVNKSIDANGNFIPTKTKRTRKVPIFLAFKPYADKYRGDGSAPCLGKVNKHTAVKEYNEIQKAIGITKKMYSLRHTFATRCEEAGISMKQTSVWMGHSSIKTTSKHYITILSDFEKQNVEKLNLHKS